MRPTILHKNDIEIPFSSMPYILSKITPSWQEWCISSFHVIQEHSHCQYSESPKCSVTSGIKRTRKKDAGFKQSCFSLGGGWGIRDSVAPICCFANINKTNQQHLFFSHMFCHKQMFFDHMYPRKIDWYLLYLPFSIYIFCQQYHKAKIQYFVYLKFYSVYAVYKKFFSNHFIHEIIDL